MTGPRVRPRNCGPRAVQWPAYYQAGSLLYCTYNSFKSSLYYNKWRSASTMRKTNEINLRKQIRFSLKPEKPLTCSEQEDYPRLPIVLFFWVGEGECLFTTSLPNLWFSAQCTCSSFCLFKYRWTAVHPNSFYPVTRLPMKRTAVTRTAHYLVTFGTGP